jgi:hypothetical protein
VIQNIVEEGSHNDVGCVIKKHIGLKMTRCSASAAEDGIGRLNLNSDKIRLYKP